MRSVDRRVLDLWDAIDRVDPLPDSWMQNAQLCVQIEKLIATQSASGGVEHEMLDYTYFMPPQWKPPEKTPTQLPAQSAEDQAKALDSIFKGPT